MEKKTVSLRGNIELEKVITYLEGIVKSMKDGQICLIQGTEYVTLNPPPYVDLGMEAEVKKGKSKLTIEIGWKREKVESNNGHELKISSEEPMENIEVTPEKKVPGGSKNRETKTK
ncbi:MAG: amphi-Trp domain-containing protein [Nitrospinae bacterium]|nr:amphi-Trp domain-containing protein [Nitrospinota bacterium]